MSVVIEGKREKYISSGGQEAIGGDNGLNEGATVKGAGGGERGGVRGGERSVCV